MHCNPNSAIWQEESADWAKRAVDVASVTENADEITEVHNAVFGDTLFAVDAPDGEHDLEDVVSFYSKVDDINHFSDNLCLNSKLVPAFNMNIIQHYSGPTISIICSLKSQEEHLTGINKIIDTASVLESPEEIEEQRRLEEERAKRAMEREFQNPKY